MDELQAKMLYVERFAIEAVLLMASTWAALSLLMRPDPLPDAFRAYYVVLYRLTPHNHDWALILLLGCFLQIVGFALCVARHPLFGVPMRYTGFNITGLFWLLSGTSAFLYTEWAVPAVLEILAGLSPWWLVFRYPTIFPSDR